MLTDFITWTANPEILHSPVTVRWYGLMFAIGFWAGFEMVWREFRHEGAPERWVASLFYYVIIATVVGARLGHVFFYAWDYYKLHPIEILYIWEGGLASHGGVIGILLAVWIYSRSVTHRSMLWTLDRLVVPVGLVAALIRLGNVFNHEIYGTPTDLPWAFRFISNINEYMQDAPPIFTVPSHPTGLYEALAYLLVFVLCVWMYWRRNLQERPGLIFGVFMVGIFVSRFFIEFLKNVQEPWELDMVARWGINQGQLLSIPFVILGAVLILWALKQPRQHLSFPNKFAE